MRPFKFFFTVAVGMILFFFLARVFLTAFLIAGVLSIGYFIFRKVVDFFRYLSWEGDDYRYDRRGRYAYEEPAYDQLTPGWKFENDLLVDDWDNPRERVFAERIIPVR